MSTEAAPRTPTIDLGDRARARLRSAGLRATAPRLAVLEVLEAAQRPLQHAEVMAALEAKGAQDRATVYRILHDLSEVGLLRRLTLGDQPWRFELAPAAVEGHGNDPHPHFVCTDCGGVQCLDAVEVTLKSSGAVPRSVSRAAVAIQLSGRCDDCT